MPSPTFADRGAIKHALILSMLAVLALLTFGARSAEAVAIPSITSLTAPVTQDPEDANHLTVNWTLEQDGTNPGGTWLNVFAVKAWNSDCSGGWPASPQYEASSQYYVSPMSSSQSTEFNIGANPHMPLCVGARGIAQNEVVTATYFDWGRVQWAIDNDESGTSANSVWLGVDVNPRGLPTSYYLSYFKRPGSEQCSTADTSGLTVTDTAVETIESNLYDDQTIYPTAEGLDAETEYCVALRIGSSAGTDSDYFWGYTTGSPVPSIDSESYEGRLGQINFSVAVTPNAQLSDTSLNFQYFVKQGGACTLVPGEEEYYNLPSFSPNRGTETAQVTGSISGLDPRKDYCVRAFAINGGGGTTPGAFETVRTVFKQKATVSHSYLGPPNLPGGEVGYSVAFDDNGAFEDTGDANTVTLRHYKNAATCDAAGATPDRLVYTSTSNQFEGGVNSYDYDLSPGTRQTPNCIWVRVDSPWGDDYDRDVYVPFKAGIKPVIVDVTASSTANSIALGAGIDPGEFSTSVSVFWGPLGGAAQCSAATINVDSVASITSDFATTQGVEKTIGGLDDYTDYCFLFMAGNVLGQGYSTWQMVRTADATAPAKVTGLASSAVTQSSATLTWAEPADNAGVTGYNIYKEGILLATKSSSSIDTSGLCGKTDHFRVSATDAAGNEGATSDELSLTYAACDVPPPPRTCFASVNKQTATIKSGKKKFKVSVSGKVSSDGQSIKLTAAGGKGAKVSFRVGARTTRTNSITITENPALATVTFKVAGKSRTLKVKLSRSTC